MGFFGLLGGLLGGVITSSIPTKLMTLIAIILLLCAFMLTFKKKKLTETSSSQRTSKRWFAFVFGIGIYNGAFGPGQATMMMQVMAQRGFDYMTCIGLTRIVTLSSGLGALVSYLASGYMIWSAAIPFSIGAIIGGQLAILAAPYLSQQYIKWILRALTLLLIGQLALQLIKEMI